MRLFDRRCKSFAALHPGRVKDHLCFERGFHEESCCGMRDVVWRRRFQAEVDIDRREVKT